MIRSTLLSIAAALCAAQAHAALSIQINYTGDPAFESVFTDAATTWQNLLLDYQDGAIQAVSTGSSYVGSPVGAPLTDVFIDATFTSIDGPGGTLGSAGPTEVALDSSGFLLTTDGQMQFDSDDFATPSASFGLVVLHEMAHVLGFGTLWTNNGVYSTGTGEYTGDKALQFWKSEFGQATASTVPVDLDGGPGTANGHWNENFGGAGLVGIADTNGRDMRDELLTGWLNPNSFISNMTIGSFHDIGFTTVVANVPEVSPLLAFGLISAAGASRGKRRQRLC